MKTNHKSGVFAALRMAAQAHYPLTVGTLLCVASSVIASLLPPLLLARIIDGLAAGLPIILGAVLFQKLCCFLSEYIRKGGLILSGIRPPVVT